MVKKDPNLTPEDIIKFCREHSPATRCPSRSNSVPIAEDQCRQDPAPRAARREEGPGGVSASFSLMTDDSNISPAGILAFWRDAGRDAWYERNDAFDAEVRRRFLVLWQKAVAGELSSWEATDEGALALVIVLDQFPRNMFRGTSQAFASDPLARDVARAPLSGVQIKGSTRSCSNSSICLHAFRAPARPRALRALNRRDRRCRKAQMGPGARRHHPAVRPFPHRNRLLGRAPRRTSRPSSTAAGLPADDITVKGRGPRRLPRWRIVPGGRTV